MITNAYAKFGPGITCFSYGWGPDGFQTLVSYGYKDPRNHPMTEQEWEWVEHPPTPDLKALEVLNADEAGAVVCDHCEKFHPDLRAWQDWKRLCPQCVEDGEDYYKAMYEASL